MNKLKMPNNMEGKIDFIEKRQFFIICFLICAVALALRSYHLFTQSLWLDETYSAWFSSLPLHELWHDVPKYETHPPFYYTLLKGWRYIFGSSEGALRMLSVLSSLATTLLLAFSGKISKLEHFTPKVGLWAALLFSINSGAIDYGQQARPYALETFTATLAILLSIRLLGHFIGENKNNGKDRSLFWDAFFLGTVAGVTLWLHNTGVFIALGIWSGIGASLLIHKSVDRKHQIISVVGAGVLALLIWMPFVPLLLAQSHALSAMSFWVKFKLSDITTAWFLIVGGRRGLLIIVAAASIFSLYKLWLRQKIYATHICVVLALPMGTLILLSMLSTPVFIPRIFEWMAPLVCLLTASGLLEIDVKINKFAKYIPILIVCMLALYADYKFFKEPKEDWRELAEFINSNSLPGDVIVAIPNEVNVPFAYYGTDLAKKTQIMYLPGPFPYLGLAHGYVGNLGAPAITMPDVAQVKAKMNDQNIKRIWLIRRKVEIYDSANLIESAIQEKYTRHEDFKRSWIRLDLYQ